MHPARMKWPLWHRGEESRGAQLRLAWATEPKEEVNYNKVLPFSIS